MTRGLVPTQNIAQRYAKICVPQNSSPIPISPVELAEQLRGVSPTLRDKQSPFSGDTRVRSGYQRGQDVTHPTPTPGGHPFRDGTHAHSYQVPGTHEENPNSERFEGDPEQEARDLRNEKARTKKQLQKVQRELFKATRTTLQARVESPWRETKAGNPRHRQRLKKARGVKGNNFIECNWCSGTGVAHDREHEKDVEHVDSNLSLVHVHPQFRGQLVTEYTLVDTGEPEDQVLSIDPKECVYKRFQLDGRYGTGAEVDHLTSGLRERCTTYASFRQNRAQAESRLVARLRLKKEIKEAEEQDP
jgi:hypothetical protein